MNTKDAIILDTLKLDLKEVDELISYHRDIHENIRHRCTQCDSFLTAEQSMKRLTLLYNISNLKDLRENIISEIKKVEGIEND